jgi:tRNA pseudouridine55 synthase
MTSHDVVDQVRRTFAFRKVGHGGTLDPMATGLLLILLGKGTKLSQWVMGGDKVYEGIMHLGIATETQDIQGRVIEERDPSGVTEEALQHEIEKMTGDLMQTPPMVSAIKQNGVPLYKMARQGKTVERKPRLIHIYTFDLLDYEPPRARFRLECTKGTYVRTLCADIGAALGCGAMLEELRRTKSGSFSIEEAEPLGNLIDQPLEHLKQKTIPLHEARVREQAVPG